MSVRLSHPRFGIDYTDSTFTPAQHHAYGSTFACRYLSRYGWKTITRDEVRRLRAGNIDLIVVFEDGANNALGGWGQGLADAQYALNQARYCGMPSDTPIYFAVDYDTAGNAHATDGYFDGVASVLSRPLCGPYGGYEVVRRQMDRGLGFGWQTYAWSGGQLDARAQLYQYSNDHGPVDYDHAYHADFGQWKWIRPAPLDPHQYHRFYTGPFPDSHGHLIDERAVVEAFDALKPNQARARRRLRDELAFLRDRIAYEAVKDDPTYHRGWRWRQINQRINHR